MTLAALAVATGAAVAAALSPAALAVGQSSQPLQLQIQVNSPATLVARGAGVEVSVTTQCSGALPGTGSVLVFLTQRVGPDTANGSGSSGIACTGTSQSYQVLVQASAGKAFKKGSVIAQGLVNACTPDFCDSQQVEATIQVE